MQRSYKGKNLLEKVWLITGGKGFIGTNLRIALNESGPNGGVVVVDNSKFDTGWRGDLEQHSVTDVCNYEGMYNLFESVRPDYVIHLAANTEVRKSLKSPMACFSDNVEGTLNCLELSKEFKVEKVIVASSCGVVGNLHITADEGSDFDALSPYSSSKICAEELSKAYMKLGVPVVILRFSNVFGPWSMHKSSVVSEFMKSYMKAKSIIVYGDGTQTRNFLYVKDAVSAIFKVVERDVSGIFCIASLRSYSINELIETLNDKFGYIVKRITKKAVEGEIAEIEINTSKARSSLYFRCEYSLLDGVSEMYRWYKEKYI